MTRHTARGLVGLGAIAAVTALSLTGCGSGFSSSPSSTSGSDLTSSKKPLTIMIGSSGDAETKAVTDAAAKWATASGNKATVTPAQDIAQQLGQAFAGSNPPDVFYVDAARFADYASVGALLPYGDKVLEEKFRTLAGTLLPKAQVERVMEIVNRFERLESVKELVPALSKP